MILTQLYLWLINSLKIQKLKLSVYRFIGKVDKVYLALPKFDQNKTKTIYV